MQQHPEESLLNTQNKGGFFKSCNLCQHVVASGKVVVYCKDREPVSGKEPHFLLRYRKEQRS